MSQSPRNLPASALPLVKLIQAAHEYWQAQVKQRESRKAVKAAQGDVQSMTRIQARGGEVLSADYIAAKNAVDDAQRNLDSANLDLRRARKRNEDELTRFKNIPNWKSINFHDEDGFHVKAQSVVDVVSHRLLTPDEHWRANQNWLTRLRFEGI